MDMAAHKGHSRANAGLFIGIAIAAGAAVAFALINGGAPLSAGFYLPDWINWVRITPSMSGLLALGLVGLLVGIVGTVVSLMTPARKTPVKRTPAKTVVPTPAPAVAAAPVAVPEAAETPAPVAQLVADNTRKASLRFEAPVAAAAPPAPVSAAPEPEAPTQPLPSAEIIPFRPEPTPETAEVVPPEPVAEATEPATIAEPAVDETPAISGDPIAAALLHAGPEARTEPEAAPDINSVIHSAMRFIDRPDPTSVTSVEEVHAVRTQEVDSDAPPRAAQTESLSERMHEAPVGSTAEYKALSEALADNNTFEDATPLLDSVVLETTPAEAVEAREPAPDSEPAVESDVASLNATDPQAEIARALTAALTHWPDATRDIAEGELHVRLSQLYHDNALQSREAFARIAQGDLSGGAAVMAQEAQAFADARLPEKAAELWRIYGALHMGRDDTAAMHAYEQVSALDTADGNIHMYLIHRYRMANETDKMLPVIGRALGVVTDRDTRLDLLTQYAELTQAGGHLGHTAQALEELSRIRGELSAEDPDNLQKRSAHAIALAKQAQVRELLGEGPKAAPLYQHAHRVFAELSARVPDHAGLKAMAENARRDAERLSA
ncbi:hypothetical protein EM6_1039 [Asticcacaulis excentricus]|uniref:Tetratricopeptide repeat protein n=2 Tax=Asticcacaulis excentricus TaxID=78587 RepID=A0A3G9G3L3_9CAUL|nr:hypothetical protein EM6_1039 [Asticcacaulis excentricus]